MTVVPLHFCCSLGEFLFGFMSFNEVTYSLFFVFCQRASTANKVHG